MRTDAAKGGCAMAIELSSGQTMSLRGASRVRMGLAWTMIRPPLPAPPAGELIRQSSDPPAQDGAAPAAPRPRGWWRWARQSRPRYVSPHQGYQRVDLDASALMFGAERQLLDQVWYGQLTSRDGAVRHTGDNITGEGVGDLESIRIDLAALPATVTALVFTVNSYSGQQFSAVDRASCRLVDETAGDEELASFSLTALGPHTAQIMAKLTRDGTRWTMTALGAPAGGQTYRDLLSVVADCV